MKLLVAIVQDQDANKLVHRLAENDFQFTKISSTGGFLKEGNTTLLVGLRREREEEVLSIIKEICQSRERYVEVPPPVATLGNIQPLQHLKVVVGGATVFILNIEKWETF